MLYFFFSWHIYWHIRTVEAHFFRHRYRYFSLFNRSINKKKLGFGTKFWTIFLMFIWFLKLAKKKKFLNRLRPNFRKELALKLRVEKEEINKTVNHFEEQIMTVSFFAPSGKNWGFFTKNFKKTCFISFGDKDLYKKLLSEQQTQISHQFDEAALLKKVADLLALLTMHSRVQVRNPYC